MRRLLLPVTAALTGGALLAVPGVADAAAYQCKGAQRGVYKICLYNQSGKQISGRTFSNAQNGIFIKGSRNITITGNTFKNLRGPKGYAGVHIQDSTGISISRNVFTRLSNAGNMHGVYLVRTSHVRITKNTFSYVTGDPVRLRDASNYNTVDGNTMTHSGRYALLSEWAALPPYGQERCGRGNVFKGNKYRFNVSKQVKVLSGGKGSPPKFGNCRPAGIKDAGGNRKI
ncbi:right-handed parallel beta-helix repeat-containing protein [Actinomadura logoneensis]|uniref:Right-handed parallel beta-helix repeat-containing protein n=1 Tax=Actinomadura logoneensis TaxID=2293572 RepID=A0A372JJ14_9ACTN|nr:right-handed parallel beta-helix repeat-containing protein [Actinomadura logoneensis]RFU39919.1 right-handed parallel beta-helix repeat-containing protein [Actinomadura logoneensis]